MRRERKVVGGFLMAVGIGAVVIMGLIGFWRQPRNDEGPPITPYWTVFWQWYGGFLVLLAIAGTGFVLWYWERIE